MTKVKSDKEASSGSRRRLGRESSKKKMKDDSSSCASSLEGSAMSKKSGGSAALRRSVFAKVKSSSWSGRNRATKDEYNLSKHGARDTNADLAVLETLVEEYKKEHEQNQREVRFLQDEKVRLASQLAQVSDKYHCVVDDKYNLYYQLQVSQHGMQIMKKQLERATASRDSHLVTPANSSRPRSRRNVFQGQSQLGTDNYRLQQQSTRADSSLVGEHKERFMPSSPEGQESIPIARAVPFPGALPFIVEANETERAPAFHEHTYSRQQSRSVPAVRSRDGATCTRSVPSRSRRHCHHPAPTEPSRLDNYFQGLSMNDHQANTSPRSVVPGHHNY